MRAHPLKGASRGYTPALLTQKHQDNRKDTNPGTKCVSKIGFFSTLLGPNFLPLHKRFGELNHQIVSALSVRLQSATKLRPRAFSLMTLLPTLHKPIVGLRPDLVGGQDNCSGSQINIITLIVDLPPHCS
jgi:hypothetical protein